MEINSQNEFVFNKIFTENKWGDQDSKSGSGSNFNQTETLRNLFPGFLAKHKIKSILDIPCGDFYWMKEIKGDLEKVLHRYTGGDIVGKIIESNNLTYGDTRFTFQQLDITSSVLPSADLIFCRDCLVHLSYHHIYQALKRIKQSRASYLLTTSFAGKKRKNKNVKTGGWRPLNFQNFPFFFPAAEDVIVENCTENEGIYSDKSLLLWKVSSLNLSFFYFYLLFSKLKNRIKRIG